MGSRINLVLASFVIALLPACDERVEPKQPIDSSGPEPDAGTCAGTLTPLATCAANEDCTSCVCKLFGHEKKCSKKCTTPDECPAPFSGCTQGFCAP